MTSEAAPTTTGGTQPNSQRATTSGTNEIAVIIRPEIT